MMSKPQKDELRKLMIMKIGEVTINGKWNNVKKYLLDEKLVIIWLCQPTSCLSTPATGEG